MITVEIRAMRVEDAETVAVLCGQLGYERTAEQVRGWIAGMDESSQAAFVACVEGEVVGWIEMAIVRHLAEDAFALICGLVVKDGVRNLGLGQALCEYVEAWAASKGLKRVRVASRVTRQRAHEFYRRLGYRDVKTSLVLDKAV
jgi:GNAT superfamily N-acetyltransferase